MNIQASGKGSALLEVCYRYYVKDAKPEAAFALNINSQLITPAHMVMKVDTR